jgi:glycosyltransferase involved in cell wall biosynthesis
LYYLYGDDRVARDRVMTDIHPNARAAASRRSPALSVLVPAHGEDPSALVDLLREEIVRRELAARVEILVFDDGAQDPRVAARLEAALAAAPLQGRLLASPAPVGRGAARNRLAAAARGAWSLFLDPDTRPDPEGFLARWLDLIAAESPWIALGGLPRPHFARARHAPLERALAPGVEPGLVLEPAASLLVHCDILAREPFDEAFMGRGWEDVEWAVRARRHAPVLIVDIPAARGVPADDEAARERCRSAARNFARLVRRHPGFARALPAFRAAQLFAHTPGLARLRPLLAHAARRPGPMTPRGVRHLAAELWRASWYGEALR